jgi:hypothetical protein
MELCSRLWGAFHDATIVGIAGMVPGTVALSICDDELRQRFAEPGSLFTLRLDSCTMLHFPPDSAADALVTDLAVLASYELQILSADVRGGVCRVHCQQLQGDEATGALEVSAVAAHLSLDSGREVDENELLSAFGSLLGEARDGAV